MELHAKLSEVKVSYVISGLHLRVPFPVLYTLSCLYSCLYLFVCIRFWFIFAYKIFVVIPLRGRGWENA